MSILRSLQFFNMRLSKMILTQFSVPFFILAFLVLVVNYFDPAEFLLLVLFPVLFSVALWASVISIFVELQLIKNRGRPIGICKECGHTIYQKEVKVKPSPSPEPTTSHHALSHHD